MTDDITDGPGADQPRDFVAEIEVLRTLVAKGRDLVAQGNSIDLQNFQHHVSGVCAEIAKNPPENSDEVMAAIERLSADLTDLADELRRQGDALDDGDGSDA